MGSIGSAIGGIASAAGSIFSSEKNSDEASFNRNWQEDMSNTAYQRAANDMQAAGLNRILAIGNPASTPSGSVGKWNDIGAAFAQGMSGAATAQQAQTMENKSQVEMEKIRAEAEKIAVDEDLSRAQTEKIKEELPKIKAEIERIKADAGLKRALTAIPQLVSDLTEAIRELGDIANVEGLQDKLEIVIQKDARDYDNPNGPSRPWFDIEWNSSRQLK